MNKLTEEQIKAGIKVLVDSAIIDPNSFYKKFRKCWHESELIGFMRSGNELVEYDKWVIEHYQHEFEDFYKVKLTIEQVKAAI